VVTSWVDPEDGLCELLALGRAPTADALHRVLVLSRPVRQSTDTMEPLWLLHRISETEPEEALTTAFLLLTDHRWRKGVSQLVRRIEDSGCIDKTDLDELAESFLAAERVLYWVVPDGWFGDEQIIVTDFDEAPGDDGDVNGEAGDADEPPDENGACVARQVHPPLRRWAAARLVARGLAEVETLIERIDAVDARAAAAIMAGFVDVIDRADGVARDRLIDIAAGWPDHGVRRAGIELVAARDGVVAAHDLAVRDPNARIREWAATLLAEPMPEADPASQDRASVGHQDGGGHRDDQQSLF
jgi:hypothetical protein